MSDAKLTQPREAYVSMKVKEKGIDQKSINRGTPSTDRGTPAPGENGVINGTRKRFQEKSGQKFNAFREMDKMRKGGTPLLAMIPDTVAVVGKPLNFMTTDKGRKRERTEDGESKPAKAPKTQVSLCRIDLYCRRRSLFRTSPSTTEASSCYATERQDRSSRRRRFHSTRTRLLDSSEQDRMRIGRISR